MGLGVVIFATMVRVWFWTRVNPCSASALSFSRPPLMIVLSASASLRVGVRVSVRRESGSGSALKLELG